MFLQKQYFLAKIYNANLSLRPETKAKHFLSITVCLAFGFQFLILTQNCQDLIFCIMCKVN